MSAMDFVSRGHLSSREACCGNMRWAFIRKRNEGLTLELSFAAHRVSTSSERSRARTVWLVVTRHLGIHALRVGPGHNAQPIPP